MSLTLLNFTISRKSIHFRIGGSVQQTWVHIPRLCVFEMKMREISLYVVPWLSEALGGVRLSFHKLVTKIIFTQSRVKCLPKKKKVRSRETKVVQGMMVDESRAGPWLPPWSLPRPLSREN